MAELSDVLERLTRVETNQLQLLVVAKETRDQQQVQHGLVEQMRMLTDRLVRTDAAMEALFAKVDPLLHSDPPIPQRLRNIEDTLLAAQTRDRVWRTIATFISPVITALLVAYFTGAM